MRFFVLLSLLLGMVSPALAYDEWQGFAEPFPIRDAVLMDGALMLATDGGMRYKGPQGDILFTSEKGLETSVFYGVTRAEGGLYAISEYGLVARFTGQRWEVVNRSFLSRKTRVVPGMVASAENILVIPFENIVSLFDVTTNTSIISLERVGDVSLSAHSPERIEIRGDSLFVATSVGSFVRVMDWKNLPADRRLSDPESWKRIETCVACRDSLHVTVGGRALEDTSLFLNGVSRIRWILEDKDIAYLVGPDEIFMYRNGTLEDYTKYRQYQLGSVYEMQAIPGGGVVAASPSGRISVGDGENWLEPTMLYYYGNELESYSYRMKVLSVSKENIVMYHVWGMGLFIYNDLGANPRYFLTPDVESCMDQFFDNYPVTVGTTVAPDGSGFLAGMAVEKGRYGLLYITKDGDVSCAKGIGSTTRAGPMVARKDGSDWVIYVSARETFDTFAMGAVDVIRVQDPSRKNGGRLVGAERKTVASLDNRTPVDLALNEKDNVLWMVTTSGVGYMELDKDTVRKPASMNGLMGAEFTSMDVDPQGNLWIGSANQGAYRLEVHGDAFDTLSVSHYTSKNGLLKDNVSDVVVDKVLGMVWFGHENGVSRYRRNDLRDASTFMTDSATAKVKVYPVPYRPREFPYLTIDNISEGARVDIYNRGGSLIRSFAGKDVHGGKVEWNGCGKNGALAAPGVYYYVVRTSKKTEKGKFLVIH